MTSLTFVLMNGALTFGVPIVLAVRELLALRAGGRGGDEPPHAHERPPAPRPLPACLLPASVQPLAAPPVRVRVLEDA